MTLILGRKRGMTQLFAEDGSVTGVTVVEVGPCVITQVKTVEREGYDAIQIGWEDVSDKRVRKPQVGHFKKAGVATKRFLREDRLKAPADKKVGDIVDVVGTTKGRGFAGTIKRHGFSRGPETHGCMNVRQPGSLASKRIGKVIKGKRLGGHMGDARHTSKNLVVEKVDAERNLLYLRGSVAGPANAFVEVQTARSGYRQKKQA